MTVEVHRHKGPDAPRIAHKDLRDVEDTHLSKTQKEDLTDKGDTDLHFHNPYGVGDKLVALNGKEDSGTGDYMKLDLDIKIPKGGTLRIKFEMKSSSAAYQAKAKVYRNGEAVGIEQTTNSIIYVEKAEDIGGWSRGDLLQIYVRGDGFEVYVRSLRLYTAQRDFPENLLGSPGIATPEFNYLPGDALLVAADTERTTNSITPFLRKEIKIAKKGIVKIKFDSKVTESGDCAGYYGYAQIYLNGSPYGTERKQDPPSSYVTFSEDLSVEPNDLIQIYAWIDDGCGYTITTYVKNFRIYVEGCDSPVVNTD